MFRAAFRPIVAAARPAVAPAAFMRPAAIPAQRAFAAAAGRKPKHEDGTLEGRYSTALFMASSNLDKVYQDMLGLRDMMETSKDFKLLIESPGFEPEAKIKALEAICKKSGADGPILNFLKVLVENKRISKLQRIIDLFEVQYRAEKGLVLCKVTSAKALSSAEQAQVKKAMEARAEKGSTILMEYSVNPAIMGGLVVKMGEAVLDNSVASRLERLQTQLLQPVS